MCESQRQRLEGALQRLRDACTRPSRQAWHAVDAEWRQDPVVSLAEDQFPGSLLHLPVPQCPPSAVHCPPLPKRKKDHWPAPKVAEPYLGRSCEELDAALDARDFLEPSRQRPVILRGLARRLLPVDWDFAALEAACGDAKVPVRVARAGSFHYTDESKDSCFLEAPEELQEMSFSDFVRRARAGEHGLYLWSVLMAAADGQLQMGALAERLQEDLGKMNWDLVEELRTAGDLGTVKKLQLFCSAQGATTACHYDMNQNIFLQLHGAKRFILFPPLLGMAALLPYPVANQRDRCARQDLLQEGPCSHLAHGRGVEAVLGPGDVLFLPQMWWHHVESLSAETVSVSLWLTTPRRTRWLSPFPQQQAAELAREWEFFLASEIGYGPELEQFLLWLSCPSCQWEAASSLEPEASEGQRTLAILHMDG
ncbi:unnamed protein product [Effrenium voratum]|nr:unnamed protein product [Effrenium voratum]